MILLKNRKIKIVSRIPEGFGISIALGYSPKLKSIWFSLGFIRIFLEIGIKIKGNWVYGDLRYR